MPSSKVTTTGAISSKPTEESAELRDIEPDESILDELEISKYLVFKKPEEDGPDIRGGNPDALIVHATKANKHGNYGITFFFFIIDTSILHY